VTDTGQLYTWGRGRYGSLGHGDQQTCLVPTQVTSVSGRVYSVSCGDSHSVLVTDDTQVFSFGNGEDGQLGHDNNNHVFTPKLVKTLAGKQVSVVSCGLCHTVALSSDTGQGHSSNQHELEEKLRQLTLRLQSTELQLQSERRSRMMSERRLEEVTNQLQAKIALGRGHRTMGTLGEQAASISIGTQTDVDLSNLSPVPRYRGAGKRKPTTAVSEELRSVVERRGWGEGETTQQVDNAEETSNPTESKLLMRASEIYKAKEQPSAEVDDPVEDTEHDPSTPNAKRKATLAEFSLGMEGHEAAVRDSYDPSLEQQDAEELLHDVLGDDDDDDDDDDLDNIFARP